MLKLEGYHGIALLLLEVLNVVSTTAFNASIDDNVVNIVTLVHGEHNYGTDVSMTFSLFWCKSRGECRCLTESVPSCNIDLVTPHGDTILGQYWLR